MTSARQNDSDEALLRVATAGNSGARETLLTRHREKLRRLVEIRMDQRIAARVDASDVVQESLLDASLRLDKYLDDRPLPFYLWLRQLTLDRIHRMHRTHLRAQKRSVAREIEGAPCDNSSRELASFFADKVETASKIAERAEQQRILDRAVEELPSTDREVLILRYLEQMSPVEASEVLGISPNSFAQRHVRAVQRLRTLMKH